jgi:cellulose synthase/poly-beta-1,6-N-acetylglucosamine synthase-like glycosyltransferase
LVFALLTVVFVLFGVSTLALTMYGLHMYALMFLAIRRARPVRQRQRRLVDEFLRDRGEDDWPVVTTQIPIYNEGAVAARIIEAVAGIDYPHGRHEIQVLDDSDDFTRDLIDRAVGRLAQQGVDINIVRRPTRDGYKAGALANGLTRARGEFTAIFDADFIPTKDFLRRAVPMLVLDSGIGCVQGRWAHLNREESWLTEAQAMGIDGHFGVEQAARGWNGFMLNFNGTGGVWRKAAIEDPKVGGWSGDTLTEDLDLSYRAQLAGWRIEFMMDLACPAELPSTVSALKSQQRRWATGSMQTACKLLPRIWESTIPVSRKLEATIHLTQYSVAVWMLILAVVARPMLLVHADGRFTASWLWIIWMFVMISAAGPSMAYTFARYHVDRSWNGVLRLPVLMVLGCGLCLNNALAVVRGLRETGGEFVRTPKSGTIARVAKASPYRVAQGHLWILELLLGAYVLYASYLYFYYYDRSCSGFIFTYALGFFLIGAASVPKRREPESAFPVTSWLAGPATASEAAGGT